MFFLHHNIDADFFYSFHLRFEYIFERQMSTEHSHNVGTFHFSMAYVHDCMGDMEQ